MQTAQCESNRESPSGCQDASVTVPWQLNLVIEEEHSLWKQIYNELALQAGVIQELIYPVLRE